MNAQPDQPTPPPVPTSGPQPQYQPPVENPGQTLGIIGLVLNFMGISLGGIILGAMSRNKSKAAGMSTTLGTISLVWGIVVTALTILAVILFMVLVVFAASNEGSMNMTVGPYDSI